MQAANKSWGWGKQCPPPWACRPCFGSPTGPHLVMLVQGCVDLVQHEQPAAAAARAALAAAALLAGTAAAGARRGRRARHGEQQRDRDERALAA
jgi:hypothetical protein